MPIASRLDERAVMSILELVLRARPERLEYVASKIFDEGVLGGSVRLQSEVPCRIGGRGRRPDMILTATSSSGESLVAVVEAKTASMESEDQTLDYARIGDSDEFRKITGDDARVVFRFLTPGGSLPATSTFLPLSFRTVFDWISEVDPRWRDDLEPMERGAFLNATLGVVESPLHNIWSTAFAPPLWISGQDGNSNAAYSSKKPLKAWRSDWVGQRLTPNASIADCFHVHFECAPTADITKATIKLHMETHPYRSRNKLGDLATEVNLRRARAQSAFWKVWQDSRLDKPGTNDILCLAKAPLLSSSDSSFKDAARALEILGDEVASAVRAAIDAWRHG